MNELRVEADNAAIIQHLTQQVAQQALRIAILEAYIAAQQGVTVPEPEPSPV